MARDAVRFTVIDMQFVVPDSYDDTTGLPDVDAKPVPTQFIGVSDPRPTVTLDPVSESDVAIGDTSATVTLHGYVTDPIADNIPRGGGADIETVQVTVDGTDPFGDADDPEVDPFDDDTPSFWQQHPYKGSFTIADVHIPLTEGTHIIRVESAPNAATNTGFDEVAVTLEKRVIPGNTTGGGTSVAVNILFPYDPTPELIDSIKYFYGDSEEVPEDAATLTERHRILDWGSTGAGDGQFPAPVVAVDGQNNVYVTDTGDS